MDSQTTVKTLKGNSPQPPLFNNTETPLQFISSTRNSSNLKDTELKNPTPKSQENGTGFTTDETEIAIFDAQKYFSESNDLKDINTKQPSHHDLVSVPKLSSVSPVDGYGRNFRTRPFSATPTASSEASWNSQTGLLSNPPCAIGVSLKNLSPNRTRWSAAKKWFFGRKCCCNGEKSVQVKEVSSEHRAPVVLINAGRDQSYKETTSKSLSEKCAIKDHILEIHHIKARAPSHLTLTTTDFSSMDVSLQQRISATGMPFSNGSVGFTFPILNSKDRSLMDGFRPVHEIPINGRSSLNSGSLIAREDDVGSDASSDLFEIESFSTQTTSYPMNRMRDPVDSDPTHNATKFAPANGINNIQLERRSLDDLPTPSVGNLSVSASEIGDFAAALRPWQEEAEGGEGKKKSCGLMLTSCRQEKAVKFVAEGPPMFPLHVGGGPPRGNKPPPPPPPLGSSHSVRLPPAFAA